MNCPDEDLFALFLQGLAPPEQTAEIERHIDGCMRCAETAAQFGRIYGARPADKMTGDDPSGHLALFEALMALLNVAFTVVALPIAWWAAAALTGRPAAEVTSSALSLTFTWIGAAYVAVWGPVGALAAVVGTLALGRRKPWGRHLAYWHALLSIPSVVLTPMAAFLLYRLARSPRPLARAPALAEPPAANRWNRPGSR
jgi:anti-sigma factor RsiW